MLSRSSRRQIPVSWLPLVLGVLWTAAPAGAALVAHWRGDGDFTDSAGNNDAAAVGNVGFAPGQSGQSMRFPDAGYLEVADPAGGGLLPAGAFTLSAFVRVDGADPPPEGGPGSVVALASPSNLAFSLGPGGTGLLSFVAMTASGPVVLTSDGFGADRLRHVAVTYDPANRTAILYADGERVMGFVNQPNVQPIALSPGLQFMIGRNPGQSGTLDGLVDDLRFYDEALGDAQIRALANVPEPSAALAGLLMVASCALARRKAPVRATRPRGRRHRGPA